jgi:hypothetical protein
VKPASYVDSAIGTPPSNQASQTPRSGPSPTDVPNSSAGIPASRLIPLSLLDRSTPVCYRAGATGGAA